MTYCAIHFFQLRFNHFEAWCIFNDEKIIELVKGFNNKEVQWYKNCKNNNYLNWEQGYVTKHINIQISLSKTSVFSKVSS